MAKTPTTGKPRSPRKSSATGTTSEKTTTRAPAARSKKTVRGATSAPMQARASRQAAPAPAPSLEQIAARAYELFEARGHAHGHHDEDWLRAEAELCARPLAN